jgi:phosphoglycolate phosphatase-like HAD superfamily hydrolase
VKNLTFLLDVDNTLLDNDRITSDLRRHLEHRLGQSHAESYWACFEKLRTELGYADYLGALQRYRNQYPHDPRILEVSCFLIEYPFADRLFPQALDVIEALKRKGQVVIVSDGDVVFQPIKIQRSGLSKAVEGNVLIYIHKERETDDVQQRYPSAHYVMVDDKLHILAGMKECCSRVTTVFVRQGHYAQDKEILEHSPQADVALERIGDLLHYDFDTFASGVGSGRQDG